MIVVDTPAAMQAWSDDQRSRASTVGLVPTMGALHAGHLALIREARRRTSTVVVSIFVNPLQFDVRDDFDRYPRPMDDDLSACEAAGADVVYAPTAGAMYPPGFQTHVEPGTLAELLEGAHRPGHFRGVATVVTKLFAAVRPSVAVFGQKDFQQLAIVRRMTTDLDLGIEVIGVPTVREADGLALSSRNRRLAPQAREAAVCISVGLRAAANAHAGGERDPAALCAIASAPIAAEPLARLEYVDVVDRDLLEAVSTADGPVVILVAAWFGEIRLIDNFVIEADRVPLVDHR